MTNDDPIAQLALANPVTEPVAVAPVADVLTRVEADASGGRGGLAGPRHRRLRSFLMPAIATAVPLAVVAAALLLIHSSPSTPASSAASGSAGAAHHDASSPAASTSTAPTDTTPRPSGTGMRGTLIPSGASFATPSDGAVAFLQYPGIRGQVRGHWRGWLATTSDQGAHWKVRLTGYDVGDPKFANAQDGWASGTTATPRPQYYVTHDGGRTWAPADVTDGQRPYTTDLSVAGGVVWAIGFNCTHKNTSCTQVMRGDASQSTLTPLAHQPVTATGETIAGGSAQTAYTTATVQPGNREQTLATHDGGASWSPIPVGCGKNAELAAAGDSAVWQICQKDMIASSGDGGQHWHVHPSTVGTIARLVPTSGTSAWATTDQSDLVRTTDGGRTWQVVLHVDPDAEAPGTGPSLDVQDATHVSIAYPVTSGERSQLMVTRISGTTKSSTEINLPPGLK